MLASKYSLLNTKDRKFSFPRVREGTDLEGNSNSDEPEDMLSDSLLCFAYFYTLSFVSFAMLRASHLPTALIILEHFFFLLETLVQISLHMSGQPGTHITEVLLEPRMPQLGEL